MFVVNTKRILPIPYKRIDNARTFTFFTFLLSMSFPVTNVLAKRKVTTPAMYKALWKMLNPRFSVRKRVYVVCSAP